jgi:hypothetical protein
MADLEAIAKKYGGAAVQPESDQDLAATAAKFGGQDVAAEGLPLPRRQYGFGEALMEAPFSAPGDLAKQLTGLKEAIESPVQTLGGLFDLAAGALRETVPAPIRKIVDYFDSDPEAAARASAAAKAVGGEYAENYGSWEAIKRSIAERPVSTVSDLSLLLSGGAGLTKLGAKATATVAPSVSAPLAQTASALQTGARRTDPFSAIAPVVETGGKMVGAGANYLARVSNPKFSALIDASEGRGQAIINALRNYDEYVAGGQPTAAVAATPAGSTKYAALQADVSGRTLPTEYYERDIANKAARARALEPIAQDDVAMAAAVKGRKDVSDPLYKAAEQGVADVSGVVKVVDDLIAKNPGNTELLREMREIRRGLIADRKTGALRTDAKEITSVIDGLKARLAKEDNKFIKGQLKEVRELLVDAVPGYRAAQEAFGQASKPINIMQVGQYLEGKLKPAIETPVGETAGRFSQALKEAPTTIKRSTGQSRFQQLSEILTPDQVKVVEGIRKDLAREAEAKAQASAGSKSGKAVPATELSKAPGFFSKLVTVTNTIIDKLQGKINEKVALELATEMLDPKLAADVLEKAMARQAKGERLADPFVRAGKGASRMMRGETGLGLRSPVTLAGVQVNNALAPENQNNLPHLSNRR